MTRPRPEAILLALGVPGTDRAAPNDVSHFRHRVEISPKGGDASGRRVIDRARSPFLQIHQRVVRPSGDESRP